MPLTTELADRRSVLAGWFATRLPDTTAAAADLAAVVKHRPTARPYHDGPIDWPTIGRAIGQRIALAVQAAPPYYALRGAANLINDPEWAHRAARQFPTHSRTPAGSVNDVRPLPNGGWLRLATTTVNPATVNPATANPATANVSARTRRPRMTSPVDELLSRLVAYLAMRAPAGSIGAPGVERKLARVCWALAQFEAAYRTGVVPDQLRDLPSMSVDDLLGMAPEYAVRDLTTLAGMAGERLLPAIASAGTALTAPVFVDGWADADILAGRCLIDVKATIHPTAARPDWFYQLLGYAWLDADDRYGIESVALYLARQGAYVEWSITRLARLLGAELPVAALAAEFRDIAPTTSSWPAGNRWVTNALGHR